MRGSAPAPTEAATATLRYGRAVRRRWPVIVVLTVLGMAAGFLTARPAKAANPLVATTPATDTYSATSLLMLVAPPGGTSSGDPSGLSLDAMGYFATTGQVPRMVAQQLGYRGSPSALVSQVQVTPNDQVGVLQISATEPTGPEAVKLVNAFDTQLITYLNDQIRTSYDQQRNATHAQLQALSGRISQLQSRPSSPLTQAEVTALQTQYKIDVGNYAQFQGIPPQTELTVVQQPVAVPGAAPVSTTAAGTSGTTTATTVAPSTSASHSKIPKGRLARTALGGAVGLLLGLALALLLDRFDTRLYGPAELQDAFGLPLLADIRTGGDEPVVATSPTSAESERYRMLQASLAAEKGGDAGAQVVLVTPVRSAADGSLVVANLALSFRDAGWDVAVVTTDASSRLAGLLVTAGVGRRPGAHTNGRTSRSPGVQVLPAAGESPGARTSAMVDLVHSARETADVVVIDAAPLLLAHDATRLAPSSDAVVLVAVAGKERVADARRAESLLRLVDVPVGGLAVIRSGRSRPWETTSRRGRTPRTRRHAGRPAATGAGGAPVVLPAEAGLARRDEG